MTDLSWSKRVGAQWLELEAAKRGQFRSRIRETIAENVRGTFIRCAVNAAIWNLIAKLRVCTHCFGKGPPCLTDFM